MPTPIQYPLVNGVRHDRSSCEFKIIAQAPAMNQIFYFKEINFSRVRSRSQPRGNHPDPQGKTRGTNEYKFDITLYEAEYSFLVLTFGKGYGDVQFIAHLQISEPWTDVVTIEAQNCTLDSEENAIPDGTDALGIKTEFNPTKILRNGLDDLAVSLTGVAT